MFPLIFRLVSGIVLISIVISFQSCDISSSVSEQLAKDEIAKLFGKAVQQDFGIKYEIVGAYRYQDILGNHVLLLTEKQSDVNGCDSIEAFNFDLLPGRLKLNWKMRDFIEKPIETDIHFWTSYIDISDIDGDDIFEPVIVYGTFGIHGKDDGRMKILVYHLGRKRAIRHQNGVLDGSRHTQVDRMYYNLPNEIQSRVSAIMKSIEIDDNGNFATGWQDAMQAQETDIY